MQCIGGLVPLLPTPSETTADLEKADVRVYCDGDEMTDEGGRWEPRGLNRKGFLDRFNDLQTKGDLGCKVPGVIAATYYQPRISRSSTQPNGRSSITVSQTC